MSALETRDLRISYRAGWRREERVAVHGLTFRVEPGEVVGFIGPNGAGKSSTIKALMGFVEPSGGDAKLLGEPAGSPAARRHVGFLPEVTLYYPWLTPLETLWMYGRLAGLGADFTRKQSEELLERVGLKGRERDRLKGFSKGMLQRVGIAQALLGNPQLLILDEVSSGLDPLGRRDLRDLMLDQKKKGVTIFFSSHELTEVAQLCDRVILLNRGRLLDERPVGELLRELRRYWIRFRCAGDPPFPAQPATPVGAARREGQDWEAEFTGLAEWRQALDLLGAPGDARRGGAELLDAGEREGALEDYFVRMVS
ncbi:MAG: transporter ATP-binding protein [Armatimonadetes bacterium]|nr:transporter ATP-binding protein [Armatimonadota bacterium]